MSGAGAAQRLAQRWSGFALDDMPPTARARAATVFADTLACIVGGLADPQVAAFAQRLAGAGSPTSEPLTGASGSPGDLAAILGFAAAALELDEGHYEAGGHPGAHAAAAALAVASPIGADDADRLAAFVVGYEVGAAVGSAARLCASLHAHGTWGVVGAAAAAAWLERLPPERFARALDLAASLSCAGSLSAPVRGASARSAWVGIAARNGLAAIDLEAAGVTAEPNALEITFGTILGTAYDAPSEGGAGYRVETNFMKLDASCRETHGALEAFRIAAAGLDAAAIEAVEVVTFPDAAALGETAPINPTAARFSIPAVLALQATRGAVLPDGFDGDALTEGPLARLMPRIEVRPDPREEVERSRRCTVTVRLGEGERSASVEAVPGDPSLPLSEDALAAKFLALYARGGRSDGAATLERLRSLGNTSRAPRSVAPSDALPRTR